MEGIAAALWIPYASATVGMRVRRRGLRKAVALRNVWRSVMVAVQTILSELVIIGVYGGYYVEIDRKVS